MTEDELDELCLSATYWAGIAVENLEELRKGTAQAPRTILECIDDMLLPWVNDLPEPLEALGVAQNALIPSTRVNLNRWREILTPMFPDLGSYERAATDEPDAIDDLIEIVYELERACIVKDHAGEQAGAGYLRHSHRTTWGPRWERLRRHIARANG